MTGPTASMGSPAEPAGGPPNAPRTGPDIRTLLPLISTVGLLLIAIVLAAVVRSQSAGADTAGSGTGGIDELSIWAAIVLGIVEGLTEYLPVSSTGHLLVTNEILGIGQTEAAEEALETYAICIQAGAIVAVFVLFQARIRQMIDGILGRSEEGRRVILAVIVAFIPTAIIGLAIVGPVRQYLFGAPPVAAAWLVGGIGILLLTRSGVMARGGLELGQITARHAAVIGVAQVIAMWPGTSRSLITIVAAVLVGMSLQAAVEFSFLLGLATLGAATAATAVTDGGQLIDLYGWVNPAVGMVVAFFAALASVKWMVEWLQQRSFDVFGYYRIVIGIATIIALTVGWL